MDAERFTLYSKFINEPGINGPKIIDDLINTPYLQGYDKESYIPLAKLLSAANLKIPLVGFAIGLIQKRALSLGSGKIDALYQAVNACLNPERSKEISEELGIPDTDILMLAATHQGVVEASELYQKSNPEERKKLQYFALYFADAQAIILGFKTSTTLLALDLEDSDELRFNNISLITKSGSEEEDEMIKNLMASEGRKISQTKKGKFFIE